MTKHRHVPELLRCWAARSLLLLFGLLLFAAPATTAQPIDLRVGRDPAVEDYDFSWVYWFQTHGQTYLREAVSARPLPWDTPASRLYRADAQAALVERLDDRDDAVRAAAIIALARMGYQPLLDRMLPGEPTQPQIDADDAASSDAEPARCLLLDASIDVRLSAWISLGLIDNERSRAALSIPPTDDAEELDIAAQALAIGLLRDPGEPRLRWLVARLDDPKAGFEVKRWCLWALRQHDEPRFDVVFDAVLAKLPSTFLVSEVLLNAGYARRRGGAPWLHDVLRYYPDVRAWPAYQSLSALPAGGYFGSTPRRLAMETRVAATLSLAQQPIATRAEDRRDVLDALRLRASSGNSAQTMDFNRGFDVISYAMHCDAEQQDLDFLYDQLRGITLLPADDPAVQEALEERETPTLDDLRSRQPNNEVRGYSAIAVGLLIRRATQGTALHLNRPIVGREDIDIERLKRRFGVRLMRAVADEDEPVSYRAACALALGLTGDERYAQELSAELGKLRAGDEAVLGYGLLALSLLGEDRAAVPARRYVTRPGKITGMDDRLGRRAALQALAIIGAAGGDDTADALSAAWGRDPWLGIHAAAASARAGRYGVLPAILASTRSESANWRLAAAVSLGEVFDRDFPSRLAPIVEHTNPTLTYRPMALDEPAAAGPGQTPDPRPAGWPTLRFHRLTHPALTRLLWP